MKHLLEIRKTDNGYFLEFYDEGEEIALRSFTEVIQTKDEDESGDEALKELLERIAVWSGKNYDKWKNNNLEISFNGHGHKL